LKLETINKWNLLLQTLDAAETRLNYVQQVYAELKMTLQPVVFSLPGNAVVVFNNTRITAESTVKALDLCFKLIHVKIVVMIRIWLFM